MTCPINGWLLNLDTSHPQNHAAAVCGQRIKQECKQTQICTSPQGSHSRASPPSAQDLSFSGWEEDTLSSVSGLKQGHVHRGRSSITFWSLALSLSAFSGSHLESSALLLLLLCPFWQHGNTTDLVTAFMPFSTLFSLCLILSRHFFHSNVFQNITGYITNPFSTGHFDEATAFILAAHTNLWEWRW